ncbi:MAG TPA: LysR substrate-binding domain-containing protein, partial [Kineosporiaceae bacterium]|nr:LysR substrate-binding domain-containing protein [Kineosporiaceae bacterium]
AGRLRPPPAGLAARRLLDDPYRLALPVAWPAPRDVADLADRPWVDGPPGSTVHEVLADLRATTGLPLPGAHVCVEFPAALALVEAGLAAALVPAMAVAGPANPHLQLADVPGLGARTVSAWTLAGRHTSPLVTVVLDALAAAAARS